MFEDIGWKSSGSRIVREMALVLFLVLYFFLTITTQSLGENIHNEFQGIYLTLHHVHGFNSSTPLFDLLAHDQVQVQAIEYRLTSITISKSSVSSEYSFEPRRTNRDRQDNQGLFGKFTKLMGMARNKHSMFYQLSSKYGMSMFSYCLPTSTSTGTFTIRPSASKAYVFTPMITGPRDPSLYFLRLTGITVDSIPLKVSPLLYKTPTIIDSGTIITRLPVKVYESLQEAFVKNMMSKRYKQAPSYSILNTCFKANGKSMTIPEVSIIFSGGARLKLGTDNIVIQVEDDIKCLAFASNGATNGISIIGNRQQESSAVVYNITNSRIGFASRGCN
ncbi:hypothetical protein GIB67_032468 [Kingdonia uniflora]|uniref:Peptidase A1 domain-containing protein n=1 Tax=Kingdonia uniflora TaxID=39325 RepID=A0A7J7L7N4_9MAGN|nr:hypothetical protein GIB67_032468 [Kingdonia uniflora]